jgi:hypothetical protein
MITGNASWLDGGCEDGHGPGDGYFYIPGQDMYTLPKTYVKTIGSHIQFPDCWDGLAFTKETQSEHMQYSLFEEGFPCPDPKWIKLPKITVSVHLPNLTVLVSILLIGSQFNYETPGTEEEYPTNLHGPTYVLATGDQFGCSLHADFMNGWKSGVLQKVIDDCSNLGVNNAKDCPVFNVSSESDTLANECQYAELMPDEEIGLGKPVDALPGCLLINGVKAQGCNSNVDFVKPTKFDTQYRSPAGWPEVTTIPTTTSTISTSKMTTSTTITTSTSATSTRSTTIPTSSSVCIAGTGAGNYEGLCSFSCHYGYCPSGPCTCTAFGTVIPAPPMTGTPGSPLPGEDASYSGLCSFACNHGYCPSTACMT